MARSTGYLAGSWKVVTHQRGALRLLAMAGVKLAGVILVITAIFQGVRMIVASRTGDTIVLMLLSAALALPLVWQWLKRQRSWWALIGLVLAPLMVYRLARSISVLLGNRVGWLMLVVAALVVASIVNMGVDGCLLEQARLAAFGVDDTPRQDGAGVRRYLSNGWRGFVTWLVHEGALVVLAGLALAPLVSSRRINVVLVVLAVLLVVAANVALETLVGVLRLRTTLSRRVGAGFSYRDTLGLLRRDAGGLSRIAGMRVLFGAALVVAFALLTEALAPFDAFVRSTLTDAEAVTLLLRAAPRDAETLTLASEALGSAWLVLVIPALVMSPLIFLRCLFEAMLDVATGLWVRQFDPAAWTDVRDLPARWALPEESMSDQVVRANGTEEVPVPPNVTTVSQGDAIDAAAAPQDVRETIVPTRDALVDAEPSDARANDPAASMPPEAVAQADVTSLSDATAAEHPTVGELLRSISEGQDETSAPDADPGRD